MEGVGQYDRYVPEVPWTFPVSGWASGALSFGGRDGFGGNDGSGEGAVSIESQEYVDGWQVDEKWEIAKGILSEG